MFKYAMIVVAGLSLAACDATIDDQRSDIQHVETQLPKGCELSYLGRVRTEGDNHSSRVFLTKCDDRLVTTTSETHERQSGKTLITETTVGVAVGDR